MSLMLLQVHDGVAKSNKFCKLDRWVPPIMDILLKRTVPVKAYKLLWAMAISNSKFSNAQISAKELSSC